MSHISSLDMTFDDLDALEAACTKRGWTLHRGRTSYVWVGRWFDDSPVPASLFADENEYRRVQAMSRPDRKRYMENLLGKCEHAIEIPGHHCTVGVVRVGEHLTLAWDWASTLKGVLGSTDAWGRDDLTNLTPFLHDYAEATWTNKVSTLPNGYLVERCVLDDGDTYLEYVHD